MSKPFIFFQKLIISATFIFFFLTSVPLLYAATYYVSSEGSDTNDGLSLNTAFKTIQKAADTVDAGDIVEVQSGMYSEAVLITKSGTSLEHIKFKANGQVRINGMGSAAYGFKLDSCSYVEIEGFQVGSTLGTGILLNHANNWSERVRSQSERVRSPRLTNRINRC